MHGIEPVSPSGTPSGSRPGDSSRPWFMELNRYHWFVLTVAALGWLFDTMDQQIFVLARVPAMKALLAGSSMLPSESGGIPGPKDVTFFGGLATTIFMLGWATGGLAFGILGDRIGRAKTMLFTILLYSFFTGLSAFSTGFWDFAFYRFLTGLGVGGEFAVGVALVAEVVPDRARPFALGLLQALSAVGNITAAFLDMWFQNLEKAAAFEGMTLLGIQLTGWRLLFVVGTLPALLAIVIRRNLKEPDGWEQKVAKQQQAAGSMSELLGDPRWRYRALFGMILGAAGVVGLWSIAFFCFDLVEEVLKKSFTDGGMEAAAAAELAKNWKPRASLLLNFGAFFGIYAFSYLTHYVGRRVGFACSLVAALASCVTVFLYLNNVTHVLVMMPILGFCVLSLFGGYAIYFPELFPTRLRSTGTSFCYNVGRFVAAIGPMSLGLLRSQVFAAYPGVDGLRYAGVTMCAVFVVGLLVLPLLPETMGKPLPE